MPKVSPKKTWSGFFGGLSAAVIGVLILRYFVAVPTVAVLLVMVLSVLSQGGDLFESWIKRRYGVKDSGQLIPGHGGIMDRADGLIVAAAAFSALLFLDFI
jgi:phosphatidate cytidylyltransferase